MAILPAGPITLRINKSTKRSLVKIMKIISALLFE